MLVIIPVYYTYKHHSILPRNMGVIIYKDSYFHIWILVSITVFSIAMAFTYNTGQDYHYYYDYYKAVAGGHHDTWGEGREIGYQTLVGILSKISKLPSTFFFFCSFLNLYVWVKIGSLYGRASSAILFVWFLLMFPLSLNLYRQYIAMALFMFVYFLYISNGKNNIIFEKKCLLLLSLLVLVFFFHSSSLIVIPYISILLVVSKFNISKWWLIALLIFVTIASDTLLSQYLLSLDEAAILFRDLSSKGYELEDMGKTQWDTSRMLYIIMIIHVIYIWFADKHMKKNSHLTFLFYAMVLSFILMPLTRQEILLRLRLYIDNFMVIGLALTIFFNFRNGIMKKNAVLAAAITVHFLYICYNMYIMGIAFPLTFKD